MRRRVLGILVVLAVLLGPAPAWCATLDFSNWVFWYHANREASDPPHRVRSDVDEMAGPTILPALIRLTDVDRAGHAATQSSAYLALGKLARTSAHVDAILRGLSRDAGSSQATEPATLALGLLRRSDPRRSLDAQTLDRARDALWGVLRDPAQRTRTRGYAAVALGLLADQPTGRARSATTSQLFDLLDAEYGDQLDIYVGLLLSIGLQDPDTVTASHRQQLLSCVVRGTLFTREAYSVTRGIAAQVLGRVGTATEVPTLMRVLGSRRQDRNVKRSCAVSLGTLGVRLGGTTREEIVEGLAKELTTTRRMKDLSTRGFAIIAIARNLATEVAAGGEERVVKSKPFKRLLSLADKGRHEERGYAVLALGLVVRALPPDHATGQDALRSRVVAALRRELESKKSNARGRAAAAVAVGLARDTQSLFPLRRLVTDPKADPTLRGYAAEGIGLIGSAPPAVHSAIAEGSRERRSEEMRVLTLHALGLLAGEGAPARALVEIRSARSGSVKGEAAIALGRVGDAAVVAELLAIANDAQEQDLTRSTAVAALGRLADPEPRPSLGRVTTHMNHRLQTDLIGSLFGMF